MFVFEVDRVMDAVKDHWLKSLGFEVESEFNESVHEFHINFLVRLDYVNFYDFWIVFFVFD